MNPPQPSSMQCETRTLWCLIDGETTPFKVTAQTDTDIDDFKKIVLKEGFDPATSAVIARNLVLRKVGRGWTAQILLISTYMRR
jgi:Crinkler effector protein N-terminal domain